MLKISSQQWAIFERHAVESFAHELREALANKYPYILKRFPNEIQIKILSNMLGRAERWGITWRSSFSIFAELMLSIAPNFDEEPHIRKFLETHRHDMDRAIQGLYQKVPEQAWAAAEIAVEDLPLFVAPQLLNSTNIEQVAAAIPLVLWDHADAMNYQEIAGTALNYAKTLGLGGIMDAPLAIIAWRFLYGADFRDSNIHPWLDDIFNHQRLPREVVAMLKFRIALDHGRLI